MSMSKKETDLTNDQTSVNPAANTKKKSTQVQNPNVNNVSIRGNTTDGNSSGENNIPPIRNNPQGNKPMSVDGSQKGPGRKAD